VRAIQVDKLKAERALLQQEVEALRAENERLAALAGDAARQLDTAIDDMRTVLTRAS
jgi:prefoldin subunit 5